MTTNNGKFIRFFWEVDKSYVGAKCKWFPIAMGGPFRRWAGNIINVIDWSQSTREYYRQANAGRIIREEFWYKPGVTWGKISSSRPSFRELSIGEMYQETAVLQESEQDVYGLLVFLNSKISTHFVYY